MRCLILFLAALSAPAATTVYQASLDNLTVLHGAAAPDPAVHRTAPRSLRVEPGGQFPDALVESAPVSLTIGKRYELSGWIRTANLSVRDTGRSPIAAGAALSMASMPFDVHSASLAGTRDWTRVSLKFTATRAQDRILLAVANGGAFQGRAWFDSVSLDEASTGDAWPSRDAVRTFGPAYRYPAAGWIYLHVEGAPYERGYQHGYLMAREIPEYLARCAADMGASPDQWDTLRTTASALFLRGFDSEILEEMRGIADGASDAGAKWQDRRLDLTDLVVANVTVELGELRSAMTVTPTGLENFTFNPPSYFDRKRDASILDRCSALAATGPATRDGKMVIGHVTWWPLTLAEQTNVWLDIKPDKGHRVLIQGYPGAIESGTDWYQNDAGLVLTETTIRQTRFNPRGTPVAFRARMAIQYGDNIDAMVKILGTQNNGLYTNEWLMGDAKTDEIAMFELGTVHTKLWRSSKNEWFGNTPGFYWGNNNAKDLTIRTEYLPDPKGEPEYVPYVPAVRDLAWLDFYNRYKGRIDEQFAFTAFRSAPLVSASTMDAKVVTAGMASRMMVWAAIGKPNQREWVAPPHGYQHNDGLFPSGYALFTTDPPAHLAEIEEARLHPPSPEAPPKHPEHTATIDAARLWKGWILPASDADTWFAAGSASYYRLLQSDDVDKALDAARIRYRGLKLAPDSQVNRLRLAEVRGVLFLDQLRRKLGDEKFLALMSEYFAANTTRTVTAQSFLDKAGVAFELTEPAPGPAYSIGDINRRLETAIIVYGTQREAGANRYAAEQLQAAYLNQLEHQVPVYKDFEVTDDLLAVHDVIFVGRPEANTALDAWAGDLHLDYRSAEFRIDRHIHAGERDALAFAAENPKAPERMVLVLAGNSALETVKLASRPRYDDTAWALNTSSAPPRRRR